jgi:hypothetical protein
VDNIDFFNRLTLTVFENLYSSFPTPVDVDVKKLAMDVIPQDAELDETWNSLQAAEDAIDFLAQEGFLTHKGTYLEGGTYMQARLTLKGLAILGSPASLDEKRTLIDGIRSALSGGAKGVGSELVKQLTQKAFAAAVAAGPALIAQLTK